MRRTVSLLAASLLAAGALSSCGGDEEPAARPGVDRIADLDAGSMALVRVDFCDLVPPDAVRTALGGAATNRRSWDNGDPAPDGSKTDVTHEFGCIWTRSGGATARAWVFARPVTAGFAKSVVKQSKTAGCDTDPSPGFGSPSVVQVCARPTVIRIRHAGLFGATWLTCEVRIPAKKSTEPAKKRANAWCASVASALDRG